VAAPKGSAKGAAAAGASPSTVRLWASRGRAAGALIGFAVAFWVSHRAGINLTDSALRGLIGAVAFSFVGWWCALLAITGLMRSAIVPPASVEVVPPGAGPRTVAGAGAPRIDRGEGP